MPNLFPLNSIESISPKEEKTFELKGSYAIDFETMKFKKNLDGTVKILNGYDAYVQWCQLAMITENNTYMAFTSRFGNKEVNKELSNKAIELEAKRVTTETLKAHPNTKGVDSFSFEWRENNSELYYEYTVTPVEGQQKTLSNVIKVR